jgi:hypothetical protein
MRANDRQQLKRLSLWIRSLRAFSRNAFQKLFRRFIFVDKGKGSASDTKGKG